MHDVACRDSYAYRYDRPCRYTIDVNMKQVVESVATEHFGLVEGFVQKIMSRRTRIFVLLITVVIITVWYWQRVFGTKRNQTKLVTLRKFVAVNCSKSNHRFDSIIVRIYSPITRHDSVLRPGIAYYHGGGWVRGVLDSRDATLLRLCSETSAVIVSVDYRLAPNVTFPAPFEDCLKATQYFFSHTDEFGVDIRRLAVAGDSAGGNLAAAVALKLRDEQFHPRPKLQLLFYPVLQGIDFQLPSMMQHRVGPRLTSTAMCYFVAMYLEGSGNNRDTYCNNSHVDAGVLRLYGQRFLNVRSLPVRYRQNYIRPVPQPVNQQLWNRLKHKLLNPYFSPLVAKTLSNLPKAFVLTVENDPLRDEALLYVLRLRRAGIQVTHRHQQGYHGDLHTRLHDIIPYARQHL